MRTVLREAYTTGSVSNSRVQVLLPSVSLLLYYINFPVPDHLSPYPHPPAYHVATHRLFTLAISPNIDVCAAPDLCKAWVIHPLTVAVAVGTGQTQLSLSPIGVFLAIESRVNHID